MNVRSELSQNLNFPPLFVLFLKNLTTYCSLGVTRLCWGGLPLLPYKRGTMSHGIGSSSAVGQLCAGREGIWVEMGWGRKQLVCGHILFGWGRPYKPFNSCCCCCGEQDAMGCLCPSVSACCLSCLQGLVLLTKEIGYSVDYYSEKFLDSSIILRGRQI